MSINISAIIVAAGEGSRIGASIPKPYIKLNGIPIIALTLKPFDQSTEIENIVVVTHWKWIDYCQSEIIRKFGFKKVITVVKGGNERQDSVNVGLDVVDGDIVLIHDAVRPFVTQDFIISLIRECKKYGAVVPGIPVTDTIKEVDGNFVHCTIQRDRAYSIQTPQVFKTNIIRKAYQEAYATRFYGTDDASLVERLGIKVRVIKGLPTNIKITTNEDLLYAKAIINQCKIIN
ncbi:MAG: 2-C-methyl-D-erythritol 4-phosphate cytidylyltransferase [bacterium]|nr:2-C-methyl-D-erythritol 4-phosphate cytidylyltransferase [bacterium]